MVEARPVVIVDGDPGHDDAVAIAVAGRHTHLTGITAVSGNAPVAATARNALLIGQILELDAPVVAGADRPLVAPPSHAPRKHGPDGLAGATLPTLERDLEPGHAVDFLIETVRSRPGTWIVAIGPLTNVALALRKAPDLGARLGGISIMGGNLASGDDPPPEFNAWCDPEAAAIVYGTSCRRILCGLQLTRPVRADADRIATIRSTGAPAASFVAELLEFSARASVLAGDGPGAPLHDPCAVLALTHPHLFTWARRSITVEPSGSRARGTTRATVEGAVGGPELDVPETADQAGILAVVADAVAGYG